MTYVIFGTKLVFHFKINPIIVQKFALYLTYKCHVILFLVFIRPKNLYFFGSGDHDMCVPFTGTEAWTRSVGYKIIDPWRPWLINNQIAGYPHFFISHIMNVQIFNLFIQQKRN